MKKYAITLNVSDHWEEYVDVFELEIGAPNAESAYSQICKEIESGEHDELIQGRDYLVSEVDENDLVK